MLSVNQSTAPLILFLLHLTDRTEVGTLGTNMSRIVTVLLDLRLFISLIVVAAFRNSHFVVLVKLHHLVHGHFEVDIVHVAVNTKELKPIALRQ